jgi:hypothetical protein
MARKITALRGTEINDCADGKKCPGVYDLDGEEELFVIYPTCLRELLGPVRDETNPDLIALFAQHVGPGEALGRTARTRLSGPTPILEEAVTV